MSRAPSVASRLSGSGEHVRPSLDLSEDDLLALASLPPPFPAMPRDAVIRALVATRYALPLVLRPPVVSPVNREHCAAVKVRLPRTVLFAFDAERGEVSRGAFFRGILDTYTKSAKGS